MSYIIEALESGEYTVCEANVHPLAYIGPILIMLLTLMPMRISRLATTELALTNKRVLGKYGRVRQKVVALPPSRIDVVRVNRGLMGLICGFGTLTVIPREGDKIVFRGIADPHEIRDMIEEAIEIAVLGHRLPRGDIDLPPVAPRDKSVPAPAEAAPRAVAMPREARSTVPLPKEYKDPNTW